MIDLIKQQPSLLTKIDALIQGEWQGGLNLFSLETLTFSTLFVIRSSSPDGVVTLRRGYWDRWKEIATPFQFHFFRRSPQMKFMEHFLVVLTIAVALTVFGVDLI